VAESLPHADGLPAAEPPGEEYSTGLPGWHFITTAARRGIRVWAVTAALGLIVGAGLYIKHASYQASTSVVLVPNPAEQPAEAILTDVALAQSRSVAALALHQLGSSESPSSFISAYKVTAVTDRVILITLSAHTSSAAVQEAHAVATAFLAYRARQFQVSEQRALSTLQQQATQARQQLATLTREINQLAAQPASPQQQARLSALRNESLEAQSQLPALQQAVTGSQVSTRTTTAQLIQGSQILDAAVAGPSGRFKHAALYIGGGLLAGLLVGLAVVIIRALVSDRLRRRDDVAHALGVPVRLSVGPVRARRGLAAAQRPEVRRIVAHLRAALPWQDRPVAGLAVVAVDDPAVPALSLVSLALSCAREGRQVVLADLCPGAPAARLLGVRKPGIGTASADGAHLLVVVPQDSVAPAGPLHPATSSAARPDLELTRACQGAEVLLSLVQLDPALGGEHLATWASSAVVMVTAGAASWAKIHAVGEMIRLAGTRLVSAVLIGADKTDESLGAAYPHPPAQDTPHPTPALTGEAPPTQADPALRITHR
jgi:capsular polysaccharide biosynthesis protein